MASKTAPGRIAELGARILTDIVSSDAAVWQEMQAEAALLVEKAIAAGEDDAANRAWFLHTVAVARGGMVGVIAAMRAKSFKDAWCALEQIEIALLWLRQNPFLSLEDFRVSELADMVSRWQSLFPYKVFASPEFVVVRESCGICGDSGGLWSSCDHVVGKVYGGRLCIRKVEDMRFCGIALVLDPVQKYSVIIPQTQDGSDPMDYRMVEWVCDRVTNPFGVWHRRETTKIYLHETFADVGEDEACPCASGMAYRICCRPRGGVTLPHTLIVFSEQIPEGLQSEILVRRSADVPSSDVA